MLHAAITYPTKNASLKNGDKLAWISKFLNENFCGIFKHNLGLLKFCIDSLFSQKKMYDSMSERSE